METVVDKRREERSEIDTINLPFLGSRAADHVCFQYLVVDISASGMSIAIPKWVVNREKLKVDDILNLNMPYQQGGLLYKQGGIVWLDYNDSLQAMIYGISITVRSFLADLFCNEPPVRVLVQAMKDSLLLKKGVFIYMGHLVPFFSRITKFSKNEYPQLKALFLKDVMQKVQHHVKGLDYLYGRVCEKDLDMRDIPKTIDIEELRPLIESEIYSDIFEIAFSDDRVTPYLHAIKQLEERLYFNYNMIVIVYANALHGS